MKVKKLIIMGIIIMGIFANVTIVQADSTATATLKASSTQVKVGETFTVTLSVSCADGINGIDTTYSYDEDKLELLSANVKDSSSWANLGSDNQITIISNSSTKITNADVYEMTFKVKNGLEEGTKANIVTTEIMVDSDAATDSEVNVEASQLSITILSKDNNEGNPSNGNNDNNPGITNGDNNQPGTTKGNANGTNTNMTKIKNISGDNTSKKSTLPKTGLGTTSFVICIGIIVLVFSLYIAYKKCKYYKDI